MTVIALLLLANGLNTLPVSAALPASASTAQQGVKVVGSVSNAKGEPIIGASVIIKGTSVGASTNVDGKFTLNASKKEGVLVVSFVGYVAKEVAFTSNAPLAIQLEEKNASLDELVVVGYGTQRKATVTGSVSSVGNKELKQSPAPNLSNSLVGRMTGVIANNRSGEPGNDYSEIYLRGRGTTGDNSPLYVIDGVANRGGFERLNPSDIESISVLKDASASIYGAQAANGVILITTKRGISSKPTITYDGSYAISQNTRTPNLMDAYQYMVYSDEVSRYTNQNEQFKNIKNGYLDGTIDPRVYANTNWMKAIFRPFAPQTQHSLSVRGGNESVKYFLSGSYLYQEPDYRNTNQNFTTNQLRANIDANITKDLTVTIEFAQRQEDRNQSEYSASEVFWEGFHVYPYLPDYYANGLPGPGIANGKNPALMNTGVTGYDKITDNFYNTKVGFNLKMPWIVDGLTLSGYGAVDKNFRQEKKFWNQWDNYKYDVASDTYVNQRANSGDGVLDMWNRSDVSKSTMAHLRLGYEKHFGDHYINAFAAYEQSKTEGEWFYAYREGYPNDNVVYLFNGGKTNQDIDGRPYAIIARQNYFGRANYAFKDRYLVEFTMRYDASQNFAPATRWGLFPGVSVGWRLSEESFIKDNLSFINNLKVKASWGKLGNDRVSPFQYLNTFNIGNGVVLGSGLTQGYTAGVAANPTITWENVDTKNIGFESLLFNRMLSIDAQYFYSWRTDILYPKQASIPLYTGIIAPSQNIGKISNQGIEVEMMHRNRIGDISYNIGGNFTFVKSNIVFMDEAAATPAWQKQTGHAIGSWLVYKSAGIYQTQAEIDATPHISGTQPGDIKYVDVDGDGAITQKDMVRIHETPIPQIIYGINMGAAWKGIELNVLWQGQGRAKQLIRPGSFNRDVDYYNNRWISATETPNAKYPRAFKEDDPINSLDSDFWLKDASFIRLKNVELAYTLPSSLTSKLKMTNVRVYVSGFNLFSIDKIKIQDPEGTNAAGMYYPQQRIFSAGLNLSF
jgi:TonB-linked outer membrane protein, SusC/RagA family